MVLTEDQGNFRVGKVDLTDSAKQRIDRMVTDLQADPKGVFIEIEGHTDNVGSTSYNTKLAKGRAEAVKRYLDEAHQVPLGSINAISYGEEKPVAPNTTRQGRAQNRRIVIRCSAREIEWSTESRGGVPRPPIGGRGGRGGGGGGGRRGLVGWVWWGVSG